jgi:hypothetical protein
LQIKLGDVIALHKRANDGAYMFKFVVEEQNAVTTPPPKTIKSPVSNHAQPIYVSRDGGTSYVLVHGTMHPPLAQPYEAEP